MMRRIVYVAMGSVATVIAIVGVWLPGIPTTFPLLIALWAFSRSSERLRRRVERISLLKTALAEANRFERERTVARHVKIIAQVSAWLSVVVVWLVVRNSIAVGVAALLAVACSVFMYRVRTSGRVASEPVVTQETAIIE